MMDDPDAWLPLVKPLCPQPPEDRLDLDAVGDLLEGRIAWEPVPSSRSQDLLYVLRLGYMTPPPPSPFEGCTIGGARSHPLWDLYVPAPCTEILLPHIPEGTPGWPLLGNPRPSHEDPEALLRFGPDTIEVELNACVLGAAGKPYRYDSDFLVSDINLHASQLSQDSYLVRVRLPSGD